MRQQRFWTPAEDAELARLYPTHSKAQIAALLGRSEASISGRCAVKRLRKPGDYVNDGCFKKGQLPWNTGISYRAGGRSAETRFKPGHRGGKALEIYQPVGSERITKEGYLQRKVNEDMPMQRRWKMVHIILWEVAHGPLPAHHVVAFRDKDIHNLAIDNLECISRRELMLRNTVHRMPKEVVELVRLRGVLIRKINAKQKEAAPHG